VGRASSDLGAVAGVSVGNAPDDALVAWVRASTSAQGLSEKISDVRALREVGALLGMRAGDRRARGATAPRPPAPAHDLQSPLR
jgi:hypothetical protein